MPEFLGQNRRSRTAIKPGLAAHAEATAEILDVPWTPWTIRSIRNTCGRDGMLAGYH